MKYLCLFVFSLFISQSLHSLIFYDEVYEKFVELFWTNKFPNPSVDGIITLQKIVQIELELTSKESVENPLYKNGVYETIIENDDKKRILLARFVEWLTGFQGIVMQGMFLRKMSEKDFKNFVKEPWENIEKSVKPREVLIQEERYKKILDALDDSASNVLPLDLMEFFIEEHRKLLLFFVASCEKKLQELTLAEFVNVSRWNACIII